MTYDGSRIVPQLFEMKQLHCSNVNLLIEFFEGMLIERYGLQSISELKSVIIRGIGQIEPHVCQNLINDFNRVDTFVIPTGGQILLSVYKGYKYYVNY